MGRAILRHEACFPSGETCSHLSPNSMKCLHHARCSMLCMRVGAGEPHKAVLPCPDPNSPKVDTIANKRCYTLSKHSPTGSRQSDIARNMRHHRLFHDHKYGKNVNLSNLLIPLTLNQPSTSTPWTPCNPFLPFALSPTFANRSTDSFSQTHFPHLHILRGSPSWVTTFLTPTRTLSSLEVA